jgi:hypothetical protein
MQTVTALRHVRGEHAFTSGPQGLSSICLLLLIAADMAFVIAHLVHRHSPLLASNLYSLGQDGGYAEMFQYLKTYWIVIMLGALWSRTRERVYLAWMLLYAYLLCDDALQIHERGGGIIARSWSYQDALGLRAQDFGELTVSAVAGLALLALIAMLYSRGTREARNVSKDLALLLAILVFFGIFVDMLHIMAPGRYLKDALAVIEDGGELFAVSAACWYVFRLLEGRDHAATPLWETTLAILSARRLRPG